MSCLKISEIYAYLEHELSPEIQTKVEEHLAACPKCQRLLAERQAYLESIAGLPDFELPSDFTEQLMALLPEYKSPARGWLYLAGGLYLIYSLLIVTLAIRTKNPLFPACLEIFKHLFNLAADLSHFIFKLIQQVHGLIKALAIFLEVSGKLFSELLPSPGLVLFSFLLGLCLTMALFGVLIKPIKIKNRS